MKIESISWRNFASYGNKLHTLDFSENETGMFYLLVGKNGAGKSTIAELIKFALYGKTGGSKPAKSLPNRFNKNLYVKLKLKASNGDDVVIERGLAPSKLNLTINKVPYDQAGKKNVDDYIENEILKIPFYVFNNIISLSINDFKSFLTMSPSDKKQIIDKIFGLEILNAAKVLVKEEIKAIKASVENYEYELMSIEGVIENADNELAALKEKIASRDSSKIKSLNESIESCNEALTKVNDKLNEIEEKLPNISTKDFEIREQIIKIEKDIEAAEEKKHLYDNKKCPTCGSDLTTDEHQEVLNDLLKKIATDSETLKELSEQGKKINDLKEKIVTAKGKCLSKKGEYVATLSNLKSELEKLKDSKDDLEIESVTKIINTNKEKKETAEANKKKSTTQLSFFKIIEEIFSDSGIKKNAIAQIVPGLNQELAKVLAKLNMSYEVKFNSEFDATIKQLKFEVAPAELSTGEKKKIDFAILTAVVRLMKMKFPGLNIIFLDELFSSIDSDGIFEILDVVKSMSKELNINAFVVNHSPLPTEMFDYTVTVSKPNNFSQMTIAKN